MARDYLAVPATGTVVEELFSGGVDVVLPGRCRLLPEFITSSMFLKYKYRKSRNLVNFDDGEYLTIT